MAGSAQLDVDRAATATPKTTSGPRDQRGVLAARILRAVREAFAETGWAGTTMRAVARAADVDPSLVYHYFGSKERLLDAATTPPAAIAPNLQRYINGDLGAQA